MWETVIGLEVHIELSTNSKIFCGCSTAFGAPPNTQCCPVCMGLPGALPMFNGKVLEYAVKAALALNCEIPEYSVFDRKNYFYPDLPKAYQISQLYLPVGQNGYMDINVDGNKKRIRIHEMHMEEDAGKLIHSDYVSETYPDYNRCGVPLIEIVSEPDFCNSKEVIAYLQKLKSICEYLGISDCKMQEGSMRVDVNLSIRKKGGGVFGTRTETKNINSFKAIERAIEHEVERQIEIIESGGEVIQQTRRWNDDQRYSYAMRSKENAHDYRYFPDPDLLPLKITKDYITQIRKSLPEMAEERKCRYVSDCNISIKDASILTASIYMADFFECCVKEYDNPKEVANWMLGPLLKIIGDLGIVIENVKVSPVAFVRLIDKVVSGKINRTSGVKILEEMINGNEDINIDKYIVAHQMATITDAALIESTVRKILTANMKTVEEYKSGKTKVISFLVGQVMRELKGKADPTTVNQAVLNELNKIGG